MGKGTAVAAVGLCLLVGGCVTQRETYLPDGSRGYSITCNGRNQSWGDCLERAGRLCQGQGYRILDRSGQSIPIATFNAAPGYMTGFAGSTTQRSLLVGCGRG